MRVWSGVATLLLALFIGLLAAVEHLHASHASHAGHQVAATQISASTPVLGNTLYIAPRVPLVSPSPIPTPPAPSSPAASNPSSRPAASAPVPRVYAGTTQQALINADRANAGLPPLTWNSCLFNVAVGNARRMAAQGYISEGTGVYQDLACGVGGHSAENLGYTSAMNDSAINSAFMNSAAHRANILGPYRFVATAWAVGANGYAYMAVEFD